MITYANRFFDKQAYGRLCKTTFICKYLLQLKLRHRINTQLHKGEQLHNLRAYLWFGGDGVIRKKQEHQQQITAQALNVLSNIVMVWNTVKRETAIFQRSIIKYRNYILPCLYDIEIPPNNGSERAIRNIKPGRRSGQTKGIWSI
ncbi:MAG: hypothetical protein ACJAZY_003373 [Spirosomataceae bacterium]